MMLNLSLRRATKSLKPALCTLAVVVLVTPGSIIKYFAIQIQSPSNTTARQSSQAPGPQSSPSPTPQDANDWHKNVESFEKLVTALGIIVGGIWAWLKFFRGRTFRSRLELEVLGKILNDENLNYVRATMQIKNVGLAQVLLKKPQTYLNAFVTAQTLGNPSENLYNAEWLQPATFLVFQEHGWIEPGETVTDQLLIQLPDAKQVACQLELIVNSSPSRWSLKEKEGNKWNARTVVDLTPQANSDESTSKTQKR